MPETLKFRRSLTSLSLVLALAFTACVFMVLVRFLITGRILYGFLVWNLVLAVVPYVVAIAAMFAERRVALPVVRGAMVVGLSIIWLIFYPNAPYLVTDFIYLFKRTFIWGTPLAFIGTEALVWYDIVLSATFAFIGHFIGLVSMLVVQTALRGIVGRVFSWVAAVAAMTLSGFGIYLGRFSRLNSWDLFVRPHHAFPEIVSSLADTKALLFSLAFSFFIGVTYLMLYAFKRTEI